MLNEGLNELFNPAYHLECDWCLLSPSQSRALVSASKRLCYWTALSGININLIMLWIKDRRTFSLHLWLQNVYFRAIRISQVVQKKNITQISILVSKEHREKSCLLYHTSSESYSHFSCPKTGSERQRFIIQINKPVKIEVEDLIALHSFNDVQPTSERGKEIGSPGGRPSKLFRYMINTPRCASVFASIEVFPR